MINEELENAAFLFVKNRYPSVPDDGNEWFDAQVRSFIAGAKLAEAQTRKEIWEEYNKAYRASSGGRSRALSLKQIILPDEGKK